MSSVDIDVVLLYGRGMSQKPMAAAQGTQGLRSVGQFKYGGGDNNTYNSCETVDQNVYYES